MCLGWTLWGSNDCGLQLAYKKAAHQWKTNALPPTKVLSLSKCGKSEELSTLQSSNSHGNFHCDSSYNHSAYLCQQLWWVQLATGLITLLAILKRYEQFCVNCTSIIDMCIHFLDFTEGQGCVAGGGQCNTDSDCCSHECRYNSGLRTHLCENAGRGRRNKRNGQNSAESSWLQLTVMI